jgi:hypothetical protein
MASIPARGPAGRTLTFSIFEIAQQLVFCGRIRTAFLGILHDERLVTLITHHAQRFVTECLIRIHVDLKVLGLTQNNVGSVVSIYAQRLVKQAVINGRWHKLLTAKLYIRETTASMTQR